MICKACEKEVLENGNILELFCPHCGEVLKKSNQMEKETETVFPEEDSQGLTTEEEQFQEKLERAKSGDVKAMVNVGFDYANGLGVKQNSRLALRFFRLAAEEGESTALYNMGLYYQQGIYVTKDEGKALEYFEKSAEKEYIYAELQLGRLYIRERTPYFHPDEGFRLLRKVSISKLKEVCVELAHCYAQGIGTQKSAKKALYYMEVARRSKDVQGMFELACWYREGVLIPQDSRKAFRLLEECAALKHRPSYDLLGEMYLRGEGVLEDWKEGIMWKKLGDDHTFATERYITQLETLPSLNISKLSGLVKSGNNVYIQYALGLRYEEAEEYVLAFQAFEKCAKQNLPQGMFKLATYYEQGLVVPHNDLKAVSWYEKSEKYGYAPGQCALGLCFEEGRGVSKNDMLALGLYVKSGNQGYGLGLFRTGLCYLQGIGTESSALKGKDYLKKAVDSGYELAQEYLEAESPFGS